MVYQLSRVDEQKYYTVTWNGMLHKYNCTWSLDYNSRELKGNYDEIKTCSQAITERQSIVASEPINASQHIWATEPRNQSSQSNPLKIIEEYQLAILKGYFRAIGKGVDDQAQRGRSGKFEDIYRWYYAENIRCNFRKQIVEGLQIKVRELLAANSIGRPKGIQVDGVAQDSKRYLPA